MRRNESAAIQSEGENGQGGVRAARCWCKNGLIVGNSTSVEIMEVRKLVSGDLKKLLLFEAIGGGRIVSSDNAVDYLERDMLGQNYLLKSDVRLGGIKFIPPMRIGSK